MVLCGLGHRHDGGFLALWTIAYGAVQALAPQILPGKDESESAIIAKAVLWAAPLTPIPIALTARALTTPTPALWFTLTLASGLLLFGLVFAVNSSVHSHLILAFASSDRVSMDVGFYYMANAAARLLGTVLSGISYQIHSLPPCLATARATASAVWARRTSCGPAPKHDA